MCKRVTEEREGEGDGSNEVGRYSVSLLFSIEETLFVPQRPCVFVPPPAPGSDASLKFSFADAVN